MDTIPVRYAHHSGSDCRGELSQEIAPFEAATTVLSLYEGAIILNKASQEMSDLNLAIKPIRHYLTKQKNFTNN